MCMCEAAGVKVTDWAEREFEAPEGSVEWDPEMYDQTEVEIPNAVKIPVYNPRGELEGMRTESQWVMIDWKYREISVYDSETEDYLIQ